MKNLKKIIFLDRDGVVNVEKEYVHKIKDFSFIEGVFDALIYLKLLGYEFIIVSNQSGIGRGYFHLNDFNILNTWMISEFKKKNIEIIDVLICPHSPEDKCSCRKPQPGLFEEAIRKHKFIINNAWMVGDSERDITAANNAGITNTILVRSGHKIDEKNTNAKFIINSLKNINEVVKS